MIRRQTTKELLAKSMMELMKKRPLTKITIKEITANCMTTPTTFYNHFKDKFDLVQWIYAKKEDEFINKIDEDYTWYHAALDTLLVLNENKKYYQNALKDSDTQNSLIGSTYSNSIRTIKRINGITDIDEDVIFALKLYFYGVSSITVDWIISETQMSPEKFAFELMECMPPSVRQLLLPKWDEIS